MTKREVITIDLDPDNLTSVIDVEGIDGPGCLEATKEFEEVLGEAAGRTKKSEFNKRSRARKHTRTRRDLHRS